MKKKPSPPEQISLWDLAENDDNRNRARVFERDWHEAYRLAGYRPAIDDYLPVESTQRLAALLALGRVDMACRYDIRDRPRVEDYLHLIDADELTPEFVAGLAFEEFMLRQEQNENPKLREYRSRIPIAFGLFHELVLIQEALAGDAASEICGSSDDKLESFPEAGDTIGNFELVDILGRGSFARVYLARDSAMGNREVALKISIDNQLEWLTLAKLQHTHIVPIYSHCRALFESREYDLICMPFYSSITLRTLIAHEKWGQCLSGRDILTLVRMLEPLTLLNDSSEFNLNDEMSAMSFAQAVAWWGACLAEAMHHAHQRRVLHRDIKPTNILITADGSPMLLDFNLAIQGPGAEPAQQKVTHPLRQGQDSIGGTLAYMAPEHLEAMISGHSRLVDHRADIYSLGAVLYEALTRSDIMQKSHAPAGNRTEMLQQALELRKIPAIPVRDIAPDVPLVLDKVIRKCIDPNPARRYTSAFELSEDLRAIARDLPLKYANEPLTNRFRRICRRNSRTLVALSVMAVFMFVGPGFSLYQNLEQARIGQLVLDANNDLLAARSATRDGNFQLAYVFLRRVMDNLASESNLKNLQSEAAEQFNTTSMSEKAVGESRQFIRKAAWQRYRMIHSTRFGGEMSSEESLTEVRILIEPVIKQMSEISANKDKSKKILGPENWVNYLNSYQITEITRWMDLLLFDSICTQFRLGNEPALRQAKINGEIAFAFTQPGLPWTILNDRLSAALERRQPHEFNWPEPANENSPIACIEFAMLARLDADPGLAARWLRRAIMLQPADAWVHHEMALLDEFRLDFSQAIFRLEIAVSLDPLNPWTRLDHARLQRLAGQPSQALAELVQARNSAYSMRLPIDFFELIDLEEALVQQDLYEYEKAGKSLTLLTEKPNVRPAIRELAAQALCEQYLQDGKFPEIEQLFELFGHVSVPESSWGPLKARYHISRNQLNPALEVITHFLESNPEVIRARELKALILSRLEKPHAAFNEMQEIVRLSNTPAHRRTLEGYRLNVLAQSTADDPRWKSALISLRLEDPETVLLLPSISRNKIVRLIDRMAEFRKSEQFEDSGFKPHQARFLTNLAIMQSAFSLPQWRESIDASLAIKDSSIPLLRAQIILLLHRGAVTEATNLLGKARDLDFDNPDLFDIQGLVLFADKKYADANRFFNDALRIRPNAEVRAWRAACLIRLGRWNEAQADLTVALSSDPFHPEWRRMRAIAWQGLGRRDLSMIDLFLASGETQENLMVKSRLTLVGLMLLDNPPDALNHENSSFVKFMRANWPELFREDSTKPATVKKDMQILQTSGQK